MDLQEYLDTKVKQEREKEMLTSPQLTLGKFINELQKQALTNEKAEPKTVHFDFGSAIPTYLDSSRGSYDELALGYELSGYDGEGDYESMTGEKLLKELKSAIGKTYYGWKGGDFLMSKDTPVWVDNSGNWSETAVIGVLDRGYDLMILTAYLED